LRSNINLQEIDSWGRFFKDAAFLSTPIAEGFSTNFTEINPQISIKCWNVQAAKFLRQKTAQKMFREKKKLSFIGAIFSEIDLSAIVVTTTVINVKISPLKDLSMENLSGSCDMCSVALSKKISLKYIVQGC
jgi:hypothetical protein